MQPFELKNSIIKIIFILRMTYRISWIHHIFVSRIFYIVQQKKKDTQVDNKHVKDVTSH